MLSDAEATRIFTPSESQQTWRILQGLCPHNQGWFWLGHGHSGDCYKCVQCSEKMWY